MTQEKIKEVIIKETIIKYERLYDKVYEFVTNKLREIDKECALCYLNEYEWIKMTLSKDQKNIRILYNDYCNYNNPTTKVYEFPIKYLAMDDEDIAKEIYEK